MDTTPTLQSIQTLLEHILVRVTGLEVLKSQFLELRAEVLALKEQVQKLEDRVTSLEVSVQKLEDRVTSLEVSVQELRGRVNSLEVGFQELRQEVTGNQNFLVEYIGGTIQYQKRMQHLAKSVQAAGKQLVKA
jgi:chromosome segregation ATPase